ncbi:MAG: SoxY-related AACIE arm protein [Beijerinckiaceae bacterium]
MTMYHQATRRTVLTALAGGAALVLSGPSVAETADMEAAIKAFTKGASVTPGKVKIDISPLVENGNSVSCGVVVESPMTQASFVRRIALFNEKNPQPDIGVFHLNPRAGRAQVDTRIRLATTQHLVAIAEMNDGSLWSDKIEVIVTIAACLEE